MSKLDQQIQKLEQQRVKLDADLATLKHQRNEDILKVLEAFPDGNVCTKTIIGLLLEGLEVASKDAKPKHRNCGETLKLWVAQLK